MRFGATNVRFLVGILLVIAMLTVACASEEPAPAPAAAPAPAGVSASEIAAIVKDAVAAVPSGASAEEMRSMVQDAVAAAAPAATDPAAIKKMVEDAVAGAPTGPSAADIRKSVQDAVAAAAPAATDPAEIRKIVEAAVKTGQGVTAADLEAAIAKQSGGQMTAADVKKVVDAAIGALPAPSVDPSQLTSVIEKAVAASVPEGTSAEEIAALVKSAVAAASADVPTRGEMAALVADALKDTAAGQLTAEDVKKIVDASLQATAMAAARTAAEREGGFGTTSIAPPPSVKLPAITDPARVNPALLARVSPNGLFNFAWDGAVPTIYSQAPLLAEMVSKGTLDRYGNTLPPVEDRVGDPVVIPAVEAIGKYGGTWRRFYTSPRDHASPRNEQLGDWNANGLGKYPVMLKSFEMDEECKIVTYHLREGHKWSNGTPFTSEDFRFHYEDLMLNADFTPALSSKYKSVVTKNPMTMSIPDETTVVMEYDDTNCGWMDRGNLNGWGTHAPDCWASYSSSEYLKEFHPDYQDAAILAQMIKDEEVDDWVQLMKKRCNGYANNQLPTLNGWVMLTGSQGPQWTFERNPYFNAIDAAGNQLPYFDYVVMTLVEDGEVGTLKALAGEIDMQGRRMVAGKLPLLLEFQEVGDYRVLQYPSPSPSSWGFQINQSYDMDYVGDLLRKRDFRKALKLAIDKEEIREVSFAGSGEVREYAPSKGTLYDPGDELRYLDILRDVDRANLLLDGLGLTARDSDGFRLRPDGSGPIELRFDITKENSDPVELVIRHWIDIGIKATYNAVDQPYVIHRANEGYLQTIGGGGGWNCWTSTGDCAPGRPSAHVAVEVGRWYETDGEMGESPDLDKYKNEDGRYIFRELLDTWEKGFEYHMTSPERKALAYELYKIYIEEVLVINVLGSSTAWKGLFVVDNDMRNVPDPRTVIHAGFYNQPPRMEMYFYEHPEDHQWSPPN